MSGTAGLPIPVFNPNHNEEQNTYNDLAEYFQQFEQVLAVGRAGYFKIGDIQHPILIRMIKDKVHRCYIKKIYYTDPLTMYEAYKKAIIKFDELEQELCRPLSGNKNANYSCSHPHQPPHQSLKSTSHPGDRKDSTGTTFGGPGRPMDVGVAEQERKKKEYKAQQQDHATKGLCYNCGKPDHLKHDCPNWKGRKVITA